MLILLFFWELKVRIIEHKLLIFSVLLEILKVGVRIIIIKSITDRKGEAIQKESI